MSFIKLSFPLKCIICFCLLSPFNLNMCGSINESKQNAVIIKKQFPFFSINGSNTSDTENHLDSNLSLVSNYQLLKRKQFNSSVPFQFDVITTRRINISLDNQPNSFDKTHHETEFSNSYDGNKSEKRFKRAGIDEEADLAILMQGENKENKEKISELLSSDFKVQESFDDPVSRDISSDIKLTKTANKMNDMMSDLKLKDSSDSYGSNIDRVNENMQEIELGDEMVKAKDLQDIKKELAEANQEMAVAQEDLKEAKELAQLQKNGFGVDPPSEVKKKLMMAKTQEIKAKERLSLAKERGRGAFLAMKNEDLKDIEVPVQARKKFHGMVIDPVWGDWTVWTKCSSDCENGGFQTRRRDCETLPDIPCDGSNYDMKACNQDVKCEAKWQLWGDWGPCSVSCDEGMRARSRVCTAMSKDVSCVGQASSIEPCTKLPCRTTTKPPTVVVVRRAASGDTGQQVAMVPGAVAMVPGAVPMVPGAVAAAAAAPAVRVIQTNRKHYYKKLRDKGINYSWSQWEQWSACSKDCGKGFTNRKRECLDIRNKKTIRVMNKRCGGGGGEDAKGCVGKCLRAAAAVGGSAGGIAIIDDDTAAMPAVAAAPGVIMMEEEDPDDDEDDDTYLTPETIIFIVFLLVAIILFCFGFLKFLMQRNKDSKMSAQLANNKPFYRDDGPGGGLEHGVIKTVNVETDFCGKSNFLFFGSDPGSDFEDTSVKAKKPPKPLDTSKNRVKKSLAPALGSPKTSFGGLAPPEIIKEIEKYAKTTSMGSFLPEFLARYTSMGSSMIMPPSVKNVPELLEKYTSIGGSLIGPEGKEIQTQTSFDSIPPPRDDEPPKAPLVEMLGKATSIGSSLLPPPSEKTEMLDRKTSIGSSLIPHLLMKTTSIGSSLVPQKPASPPPKPKSPPPKPKSPPPKPKSPPPKPQMKKIIKETIQIVQCNKPTPLKDDIVPRGVDELPDPVITRDMQPLDLRRGDYMWKSVIQEMTGCNIPMQTVPGFPQPLGPCPPCNVRRNFKCPPQQQYQTNQPCRVGFAINQPLPFPNIPDRTCPMTYSGNQPLPVSRIPNLCSQASNLQQQPPAYAQNPQFSHGDFVNGSNRQKQGQGFLNIQPGAIQPINTYQGDKQVRYVEESPRKVSTYMTEPPQLPPFETSACSPFSPIVCKQACEVATPCDNRQKNRCPVSSDHMSYNQIASYLKPNLESKVPYSLESQEINRPYSGELAPQGQQLDQQHDERQYLQVNNSRDSSREPSREPSRTNSRSPFREPSRQYSTSHSREPLRGSSREPLRTNSRTPLREPSRRNSRSHSREPPRGSSRERLRTNSRSPLREPSRLNSRLNSRSQSSDSSRSDSRTPSRRNSRHLLRTSPKRENYPNPSCTKPSLLQFGKLTTFETYLDHKVASSANSTPHGQFTQNYQDPQDPNDDRPCWKRMLEDVKSKITKESMRAREAGGVHLPTIVETKPTTSNVNENKKEGKSHDSSSSVYKHQHKSNQSSNQFSLEIKDDEEQTFKANEKQDDNNVDEKATNFKDKGGLSCVDLSKNKRNRKRGSVTESIKKQLIAPQIRSNTKMSNNKESNQKEVPKMNRKNICVDHNKQATDTCDPWVSDLLSQSEELLDIIDEEMDDFLEKNTPGLKSHEAYVDLLDHGSNQLDKLKSETITCIGCETIGKTNSSTCLIDMIETSVEIHESITPAKQISEDLDDLQIWWETTNSQTETQEYQATNKQIFVKTDQHMCTLENTKGTMILPNSHPSYITETLAEANLCFKSENQFDQYFNTSHQKLDHVPVCENKNMKSNKKSAISEPLSLDSLRKKEFEKFFETKMTDKPSKLTSNQLEPNKILPITTIKISSNDETCQTNDHKTKYLSFDGSNKNVEVHNIHFEPALNNIFEQNLKTCASKQSEKKIAVNVIPISSFRKEMIHHTNQDIMQLFTPVRQPTPTQHQQLIPSEMHPMFLQHDKMQYLGCQPVQVKYPQPYSENNQKYGKPSGGHDPLTFCQKDEHYFEHLSDPKDEGNQRHSKFSENITSTPGNDEIENLVAEAKRKLLGTEEIITNPLNTGDTETSSLSRFKPFSEMGCLISGDLPSPSWCRPNITSPMFTSGTEECDTSDHLMMMTSLPSCDIPDEQRGDKTINSWETISVDTGSIPFTSAPTSPQHSQHIEKMKGLNSHTKQTFDEGSSDNVHDLKTNTDEVQGKTVLPSQDSNQFNCASTVKSSNDGYKLRIHVRSNKDQQNRSGQGSQVTSNSISSKTREKEEKFNKYKEENTPLVCPDTKEDLSSTCTESYESTISRTLNYSKPHNNFDSGREPQSDDLATPPSSDYNSVIKQQDSLNWKGSLNCSTSYSDIHTPQNLLDSSPVFYSPYNNNEANKSLFMKSSLNPEAFMSVMTSSSEQESDYHYDCKDDTTFSDFHEKTFEDQESDSSHFKFNAESQSIKQDYDLHFVYQKQNSFTSENSFRDQTAQSISSTYSDHDLLVGSPQNKSTPKYQPVVKFDYDKTKDKSDSTVKQNHLAQKHNLMKSLTDRSFSTGHYNEESIENQTKFKHKDITQKTDWVEDLNDSFLSTEYYKEELTRNQSVLSCEKNKVYQENQIESFESESKKEELTDNQTFLSTTRCDYLSRTSCAPENEFNTTQTHQSNTSSDDFLSHRKQESGESSQMTSYANKQIHNIPPLIDGDSNIFFTSKKQTPEAFLDDDIVKFPSISSHCSSGSFQFDLNSDAMKSISSVSKSKSNYTSISRNTTESHTDSFTDQSRSEKVRSENKRVGSKIKESDNNNPYYECEQAKALEQSFTYEKNNNYVETVQSDTEGNYSNCATYNSDSTSNLSFIKHKKSSERNLSTPYPFKESNNSFHEYNEQTQKINHSNNDNAGQGYSGTAKYKYSTQEDSLIEEQVSTENMRELLDDVTNEWNSQSSDDSCRHELSLILTSSIEESNFETCQKVRSASAISVSKQTYLSRSQSSSPMTQSIYSRVVCWSSSERSTPDLTNESLSHHVTNNSLFQCSTSKDVGYISSGQMIQSRCSSVCQFTDSERNVPLSQQSYDYGNQSSISKQNCCSITNDRHGLWTETSSQSRSNLGSGGARDGSEANTLFNIPSIVNSSEISNKYICENQSIMHPDSVEILLSQGSYETLNSHQYSDYNKTHPNATLPKHWHEPKSEPYKSRRQCNHKDKNNSRTSHDKKLLGKSSESNEMHKIYHKKDSFSQQSFKTLSKYRRHLLQLKCENKSPISIKKSDGSSQRERTDLKAKNGRQNLYKCNFSSKSGSQNKSIITQHFNSISNIKKKQPLSHEIIKPIARKIMNSSSKHSIPVCRVAALQTHEKRKMANNTDNFLSVSLVSPLNQNKNKAGPLSFQLSDSLNLNHKQ